MKDRLEVIAAFADGEQVAADELDAALADAEGRAYLIDVLALRGLIEGRRAEARRLHPVIRESRASRAAGLRASWLGAAAALVIAAVAGGYLAGRQQGPIRSQTDDGPTVAMTPAAAPAPTHVIRIENGVNWNERAGGN